MAGRSAFLSAIANEMLATQFGEIPQQLVFHQVSAIQLKTLFAASVFRASERAIPTRLSADDDDRAFRKMILERKNSRPTSFGYVHRDVSC
jgi:hypothetical protein